MKHQWLTILLCLAACTAQATFELSDPATEIYEEIQEAKEEPAKNEQANSVLCTMDTDLEKCFCINKETGKQLPVTHEQCTELTSKITGPEDP
jgi:hypothetical protein